MNRQYVGRRRAMSLVEGMFFFVIAMIVISVVWTLIKQGTRIGRRAMESVTLQTGMRQVVEYMTRDVAGAYMIAEPHGQSQLPATRLVLYTFASRDARRRLSMNQAELQPDTGMPGSPYPFGLMQDPSAHQMMAMQIVYEWDEQEHTVTRETTAGTLTARSASELPRLMVEYEFAAVGAGAGVSKVLAENIRSFELYPAGYDVTDLEPLTGRGRVLDTRNLPGLPLGALWPPSTPLDGPKQDRTTLVVLKIGAAFERSGGGVDPKALDSSRELVTKIWSYPKLYDHVYRPYFSSVDPDLRY